jgi:hypothetical protein
MSGTGEARADFAGEERSFRIRLGEIRRIEERCKSKIGPVCQRLAVAVHAMAKAENKDGSLNLGLALALGIEIGSEDVRAVIHEGLTGFGMKPGEATALVRREIDDRGLRGLLENVPAALQVMVGSQETPAGEGEDEPPGEPQPAATPPAA